jgi:hypothetical protein
MLNFRRAFKRRKFKCILAWVSPYNSCVLRHSKLSVQQIKVKVQVSFLHLCAHLQDKHLMLICLQM